jgi:hypothetical protein
VVVVPEEMEEPVGQVEVQLIGEGPPVGAGLPPGGVEGKDDVAEVQRPGGARGRRAPGEAEDVGGSVLPPPTPVQVLDAGVCGEEDRELHIVEVESVEEARGPGAETAELPAAARDLGTNLDDDPTLGHRRRTLVHQGPTFGWVLPSAGAMPRRRTAPRSNEPFLLAMRLLRDDVPTFDIYPFSLPVVRGLRELPLDAKVTFLIGENGSGKSTLIEAIAVAAGYNPEGGNPCRGNRSASLDVPLRSE